MSMDEHKLRVDIEVDANTEKAQDRIEKLRQDAENIQINMNVGGDAQPGVMSASPFGVQSLSPSFVNPITQQAQQGQLNPALPPFAQQGQFTNFQPYIPGITAPMVPVQTMPNGTSNGVPLTPSLDTTAARVSGATDVVTSEQQRIMNRLAEIDRFKQETAQTIQREIDIDVDLFQKNDPSELPVQTKRRHRRRSQKLWGKFADEYGTELSELERQAEGLDEATGIPGTSAPIRNKVQELSQISDGTEKLNSSMSGQGGLIETFGKAAQAIHILTQAHQLLNAYVIAPMMTEAQSYAVGINAFDMTSNYSNQRTLISAAQRQRVLERNLEADQSSSLWSMGGVALGGIATVGLMASGVGAPLALLLGAGLLGGAGSFMGSYTKAGATAENIKEQAETEARMKYVEQTLANIQSGRGAILGGNPFGATGLMSFNPRIQEAFGVTGFDLSTDEGRLWTSGLTESNLGFMGQTYQRAQAAVNQFIPVWKAEANFRRVTGRNPLELAGYTSGEEVGISEAYRQNTGSYDAEDLRETVRIARGLGMSQAPQQMFGIGRQLQYFNEQNNLGSYATLAAGVSKEIYGEDRYKNKSLEVMQSLLEVNMEMLQVDKDASLSQSEYLARIPSLLFGNESPYGRIDQMGRGVLQGLTSLTRPQGDAHRALLAQAYGEPNPFELEKRFQGGLWYAPEGGKMNIEMITGFLDKQKGNDVGIQSLLSTLMPQLRIPLYETMVQAYTGKRELKYKNKTTNEDGEEVIEEMTLTGEQFNEELKKIYQAMAQSNEAGLAKVEEFKSKFGISLNSSVSAAENFSESMDAISKSIAESMRGIVFEFTTETAKMTAEIVKSGTAQQRYRTMINEMQDQISFDMHKMGVGNSKNIAALTEYSNKHFGEGTFDEDQILQSSASEEQFITNLGYKYLKGGVSKLPSSLKESFDRKYSILAPNDRNGYQPGTDDFSLAMRAIVDALVERVNTTLGTEIRNLEPNQVIVNIPKDAYNISKTNNPHDAVRSVLGSTFHQQIYGTPQQQ